MQNRFLAIAALVTCSVLPLAAVAQVPPQYGPVAPRGGYDRYHNHDLRWVTGRVGTSLLTLEKTRPAGSGPRTAAVGYMRDAHRELRMAEEFARAHGYQPVDLGYIAPPANPYGVRSARQSPDPALFDAVRHCPQWIEMLKRENRDFGGHRLAAIDALQRAQDALNAAMQAGQ